MKIRTWGYCKLNQLIGDLENRDPKVAEHLQKLSDDLWEIIDAEQKARCLQQG